jgi:hypothetical protein
VWSWTSWTRGVGGEPVDFRTCRLTVNRPLGECSYFTSDSKAKQWMSLSMSFICPKALWLLQMPNPWLSALCLTWDIEKNINSRMHFKNCFWQSFLLLQGPAE